MDEGDGSKESKFVIGIDLGTTYSAVAVYQENNKNRNAEIVHDSQGNAAIPSIVAFTKKLRLIGYEALDQIGVNPENTICEVKRLLGRKFDDPQVQKEMNRWPFIITNVKGEARLHIEHQEQVHIIHPEIIVAMLLIDLKTKAKDFVNAQHSNGIRAVLTVPANFGQSQRLAIKAACKIAKINCIRIITEPSAVALAYAWNCFLEKGERDQEGPILVFDMGGGTTDVSIVQIGAEQQYEVLAAVGEDIGGEDFDTILTDYCLKKNKLSAEVIDEINDDYTKLIRIRRACSHAKCTLSAEYITSFKLDDIIPGKTLYFRIRRYRFQKLIKTEVTKVVSLITKCISTANILPADIQKVVLAGGSCRIPYVQEMIRESLPSKIPILSDLCKDEVVACGAALQAANDAKLLDLHIVEVIPWSLGIELYNDTFDRIICKNTRLPIKCTKLFLTVQDNQIGMHFPIYEGDNDIAKENKYLGEMTLYNIRLAPAGQVKAQVTFEIDEYGILQASAVENNTNNTITVKIARNKNLVQKHEIENEFLTEDEELMENKDEKLTKGEDEEFTEEEDAESTEVVYTELTEDAEFTEEEDAELTEDGNTELTDKEDAELTKDNMDTELSEDGNTELTEDKNVKLTEEESKLLKEMVHETIKNVRKLIKRVPSKHLPGLVELKNKLKHWETCQCEEMTITSMLKTMRNLKTEFKKYQK